MSIDCPRAWLSPNVGLSRPRTRQGPSWPIVTADGTVLLDAPTRRRLDSRSPGQHGLLAHLRRARRLAMRRIFLAINPPADVRAAIWDATAPLRESADGVRWVARAESFT